VHKRIVALCLAVIAAACTPTNAPQTAGGGNAWTQHGHLRIGVAGEEPDGLNLMFANDDSAVQIANLIDEPLLRYDPNGNFVPAALREVPTLANGGLSRDGRTVTLRMRPGMQWSDGAPYDGRDVAFTWHAVMDASINVRSRDGWDDITGMTLRDANQTIIVHLRQPRAAILGIFAVDGAGYPPLPEHLLHTSAHLDHSPFNAAPLGAGPFVLTKWNHGSSLEFTANPHYWRGAPGLARISYRIIPDGNTAAAAARTHEVDLFDSVPETAIADINGIPGTRISTVLTANYRRLAFNTSRPVLHDVRVRTAIAQAIDWDRMNATIYHGYNTRAATDILPSSWAAPHGIVPWSYNVKAAAALLDAAGWRRGANGVRAKDGAPLTFSVSTTPSKPANVQAEVQMQAQLKAVGIALVIKNYPTSLLFARDGPIYTGRFDSEFTIATNAPDPDNEGVWSGTAIPPHGANTTYLDDPVITQTSHAAALSVDPTQRRLLYQREEDRIHTLVPAIFLYWQNVHAVVNTDMHGWRPASYVSDFWNCWEWTI